ncbi:MAG: MoaD/ThiS family protein [Desulfobacterales bacterium]|jgi:sulfur carrier protein ThiS
MKVRIKLYGTLSLRVPGYDHSQGIEIELAEGATVKDLLDHLKISESQGAVVTIDGRIRKAGDKIPEGTHARVFQSVGGG